MDWIVYLIIALAILVLVEAGYFYRRLRRIVGEHSRTEWVRCRNCGYGVGEGVSWQCAECGADLRLVGIRKDGIDRPGYAWENLIARTVAVILIAVALGAVVTTLLPSGWEYRAEKVIQAKTAHGLPAFQLWVKGRGRWWGRQHETLGAALVSADSYSNGARIEVDIAQARELMGSARLGPFFWMINSAGDDEQLSTLREDVRQEAGRLVSNDVRDLNEET